MKRYIAFGLMAAMLLFIGSSLQGKGRGGRGGGGGGGFKSGGGGGGFKGSAVSGPYGGGGGGYSFKSSPVVGPGGGSWQGGSGGGSYTTKGGSTINYKGAGAGVTGPGGGAAGKGVGGISVTGQGGQTAGKVGKVGGATGPGGNTIAGKSGTGYTYGAYGSGASHYKGGVAIGPQGGVAGGSKVGAGAGYNGKMYVGGSHGIAAGGPYGAVAGGSKGGIVAGKGGVVAGGKTGVVAGGRYGTYFASSKTLATRGNYVRQNFHYYNTFNPGWYARYPGAWFVAGWTAARIWSTPSWGYVSEYCGYPESPVYYDYGTTVVYQDDTVFVNGESAGTPEEYAQQAQEIATVGQEAKVTDKADDWEPLGVFALVQGEETTSYNIFQLAINKHGIIKGNYYNALTDASEPVSGSVDKTTQRAAWTVGKSKAPLYEAGIANLTKDETTVLVHFGKDQTQQFMLVRVEQPASE
jgi:hypothetical protein